MGDSAIINIIKQNGEIFIQNGMVIDGCRYLIWIFVSKFLAPIAAACEGLYDAAFDLVTFGTSTRVGTFIRSAGVVFTAIMMLSLMMLGITFILWHEKKPQLVINLVVLVLTTASSGYLMAQMSSAVTTGKDAILGSTSSAQTYETISNSFYDLRYIDQAVGLGNVSKPYPTRTMTKDEFNSIDINEVINPKSDGLSSDAKSILGKYLVNSIGGESLEKVSDGLTFYNSGASNGIMNGYYYRYYWSTWNILLTLAGSLLLYLAMAYKVIRIEFELGVYRVLAYIEAANLNNTQKALKILDAIKNSYIVLLMTCVMIKFYSLACSMIDGLTSASDIQRSIFKVFIALAVIDGPNLIQQLFGIDVGLKSIVGTMLAGGQAGAALVRGAGGAARAIGGIAGAMTAGAAGADEKEGGAGGAAQMGADRGDIKNAQERNDGAASTDSLNGGASYGSIPDMADDGGYSPQPSENNPLFGGIPDKSGDDGNGSSTDGSSGGSGGAGGSGGKSGGLPGSGRPGNGTSGKPSTGGTAGTGRPAADTQPPAGPSGGGAGGTEPGTGPQPLNGAPGDEAPGYAGADDRGLTGNDGRANTENTAAGGPESADAGQQAALNGGPGNVPLAGAEGRTEGAGNGGTAAQHSDMPGLSDEPNLFKGLAGGAGEAGTSGASGASGAAAGQNDINASPYMGTPGTPEAITGSGNGSGNVPGGPGTSPAGAEGSRPGQPAGSGMNSMPGGPSASDLGIPSGQNTAASSGSGKTDARGAEKHADMSTYSGNLFGGMSGGAAGGGGDRPMPQGSAGGSDHANMPGQMGYETQAAGLGGGSAAPSSGGSSSGSGSTPAPAAPESEFSGNMFSGHGASSKDSASGQNGGSRAGTNGTGSMGNMAAPEPGREAYKGGSNGQTQGPETSPERRENVSRGDRKNLGSGQKPGTETREKTEGTGRKSGGRAGTNGSMNNMAAPDPDRADYKQGNQERTGARGGRKDLTTPPGSKKTESSGQKGDKK